MPVRAVTTGSKASLRRPQSAITIPNLNSSQHFDHGLQLQAPPPQNPRLPEHAMRCGIGEGLVAEMNAMRNEMLLMHRINGRLQAHAARLEVAVAELQAGNAALSAQLMPVSGRAEGARMAAQMKKPVQKPVIVRTNTREGRRTRIKVASRGTGTQTGTGTPGKNEPPKNDPPTEGAAGAADAVADELDYSSADRSNWSFTEVTFGGATHSTCLGKKEQVSGVIADGIERLKAEPSTYIALWYQLSALKKPDGKQRYTLLHRARTKGLSAADVGERGRWKMIVAQYQRLAPLEDLGEACDEHTDAMVYEGDELAKPLSPGRGQGLGDVPTLKLIGDVDPADITQGSVGDCWLLSGIASLAEYDGAIARLFRKTLDLAAMPKDIPNQYTVTLYNLQTWAEVDVVIDERLACKPDGTGLLGCEISRDGELWACYLEKAVAVHCGGWDKIDGGQCTHAWALLLGCKELYTISRKYGPKSKFCCYGLLNPNTGKRERLRNSPHDGFQSQWPVAWPEVGGGGAMGKEQSEDELFAKMCAWDDSNYLMAAGTRAGSDQNSTHGVVDGHAYSILECVNDAAGTPIDLVQVRNPWGSGEIADGIWGDGGVGWKEYPQIAELLKPEAKEDGIFWLSKEEFFTYFATIYLSACNMAEFR